MKISALVLLFVFAGCATKVQKTQTPTIEAPLVKTEEAVMIDHKFFKISYNPTRRLANYVTYQLTAEQLRNKRGEREDKFIPDPFLVERKIPYVVSKEYNKSGYDRGHLAPSADFAWSQEANDLTFVMSNMAPQTPNLNRNAWKRLEDQVRKWACGEEKVTVITGPVLEKNLPRLASGLEIPQKFFKIIIDETPPKKTLSFLYYQTDKGDVLAERMVPVQNVEKMTGMAFNQNFPETKRLPASLSDWKEADCNE